MPAPVSMQLAKGELMIDSSFSVAITGQPDVHLQRAVDQFLASLRRQTAMPPQDLKVVHASPATLVIHTDRPNKEVQEVGEDESYSLEITASSAKLNAAAPLGAMRGLQTFLQLLQTGSNGFYVHAVTIQDHPRFVWRGLMIDVGRHFIPLDVLKRNLDGMAAVKLNVFHWHLSEDQGFRIESKKFPKLQQLGSDGMYYTQDEVRDLIAYARDRGIRVVPEFDMPGHSTAWFVGYPELASGPGPYQIERRWGVFDPAMDPTQEGTYRFLDKFIGEMAALFPDKYFHIGGDEVNGKQWDANPKIQAFMRVHGLKNKEDLQAYFTGRVEKIIARHGKIMIGWDEILRPDLPKEAVVQSWHDQDHLADAVKQGHTALLSYGYYLDQMWTAASHYAVDPISGNAAKLSAEEQQRILGGEACMWNEYASAETLDSRIWPRMAPIAERFWSAQSVTDAASMYQRMEATSLWLDWFGLTHNTSYEPMLRRIAGESNVHTLRTLADVVEPTQADDREETAKIQATSLVPLNRLVDAVRPESAKARYFAELVNRFVSGKSDDLTRLEIRAQLIPWRDNAELLQGQSFLLKEIVPLSDDLSAVAAAGLQALDYLRKGERPPGDWKTQQLAVIDEAQKPKAQLLLAIAPAVRKLVEYSAGPAPQK
jgi:hexosaminidase